MANYAATSDAMFAGELEPEKAKDYFEEAEKNSIVQAVAQKIPMGPTGVSIPHWNGNVTADWVDEGAQKPITKGDFTKQSITPAKIATIFVASAEVVRANPHNYIETMRKKVAEAIALRFDEAVLFGTATPFGNYVNETTKEIGLDGDAYGNLNTGLKLLSQDGRKWRSVLFDETAEPILNDARDDAGRPLFIDSPLELTETNAPFRRGRVIGRNTILSDHLTNEGSPIGFMGDFNQVLWGQVGGLTYDVSDSASLDISSAQNGSQIVSLWQNNLVAVRVETEFAALVHDPEDFVRITEDALVQTWKIDTKGATGGTFNFRAAGKKISAVAYNVSDANLRTAIVNATGLDAGKVTVTSATGVYTVVVPASLGGFENALTGGTSATAAISRA
ncbi:phage major capsid protein [Gordonia sp. X0973]|uniref:phage major capsid protein n=1 Tax=Gordonia sp. X0973 TaxID=2742602 RepID=UPI000F51C568|nr:phage major capsid protein [Gordonia sp. X0973]QKT07932.1 phage major capsid protein [Gordonia sp. X0973]